MKRRVLTRETESCFKLGFRVKVHLDGEMAFPWPGTVSMGLLRGVVDYGGFRNELAS